MAEFFEFILPLLLKMNYTDFAPKNQIMMGHSKWVDNDDLFDPANDSFWCIKTCHHVCNKEWSGWLSRACFCATTYSHTHTHVDTHRHTQWESTTERQILYLELNNTQFFRVNIKMRQQIKKKHTHTQGETEAYMKGWTRDGIKKRSNQQ